MMKTRRFALAFATILGLSLWSGGASLASDPAELADNPTLTVYLVRHAEKQAGKDPSLTEAGERRAKALGDRLKDAGIKHIHTTLYKRTGETAGIASHQIDGVDIIKGYDPRKLDEFAERLIKQGGTHLVVGHSNTTPHLVMLLGGDPGEGISEDMYDRLYMVLRSGDGNVTTLNLQYGAASKEKD